MVEYSPPPADLDRLNPIQRYMQKGQLERQDYVYLFIFVLGYIALRPVVKKGAKWLLAPKGFEEGEQAHREYAERREQAEIGANAIREGKDHSSEGLDAGGTGAKASGVDSESAGRPLNRKAKAQDLNKSEVDKLLDWDDEPAREKQEGERSDVMTWLDKWDK